MSDRVARLRRQSLEAVPSLSTERAELMTEFYREFAGPVSVPVQRALAFQYVLEHKSICINDGELIVGERGPAPKATPTYPELCCHTLDDLAILHTREKISFAVGAEARATYRDSIIPFWAGKSIRWSAPTSSWTATTSSSTWCGPRPCGPHRQTPSSTGI